MAQERSERKSDDFEKFITEHWDEVYPKLVGMVNARVRDLHEAEDIVGTVLANASRLRPTNEEGKIINYLFMSVTNRAFKYFRDDLKRNNDMDIDEEVLDQ